MRICIYGAGAIGGHLAAKLAAAGNEVSVVARGAQLEAARRSGFKLIHGDEEIRGKVKAAEAPGELGAQDVVIVTLKANSLVALPDKIGALLQGDTAVVFAQNGVPWWYPAGLSASRPKPPDLSRLDPGGRLAKALAPERIVGAVVYSANDVVEPGTILNHTPGNNMLVVGECDDRQSSRISALRSVLEKAGMSSPSTRDIREAVWNKVIVNLGTSTLSVLTEEGLNLVRADPALREMLERITKEGKQIAAAHGVDSDRAPQRPSGGHKSGNISHKTSMLQDYERGRPMEVESQLLTPLAFARAARVVTPTLEALVPLAVHKAAAKGLYTT